MNKEDLIIQVNKIYQALGTISVRGYNDVKTFGNCLDAIQELAKNINSYEQDLQNMIEQKFAEMIPSAMQESANEDGIVPVDSSKPKPKRIKKEVNTIGEN